MTALVTLLLVLGPTPAQAQRGKPWPGHPDRRILTRVVRPGDTASGLAVRYHAWTRELIRLNHLDGSATIFVGQRIRIPVVVSATPAAPRKHTRRHRPSAKDQRMHAAGWRHWRHQRPLVRRIITQTAHAQGVPASLALAIAWQESGWHQPVVSSAGAIGVMQVLPGTGVWMSLYAHRPLNLRNTHHNITAGVILIRVLLNSTSTTRRAIGAYYQGLGAVRRHGLYPETRRYVANVQAIRDRIARGSSPLG